MERGSIQYNILDALSHFTFVTMSFFLVEGYKYTKSKKAYVKRMFLFGWISQLPYILAFSGKDGGGYVPFNIFFTLAFCFLMIWGLDSLKKKILKVLLVVFTIIICTFCDWMFYAPLITLAFYWADGNKKRLLTAYIFDVLLVGTTGISGYLVCGNYPAAGLQLLIESSGIILSGLCVMAFYNGKRMNAGKKFNKWFFYWFYPAHLLVLGIIRVIML